MTRVISHATNNIVICLANQNKKKKIICVILINLIKYTNPLLHSIASYYSLIYSVKLSIVFIP